MISSADGSHTLLACTRNRELRRGGRLVLAVGKPTEAEAGKADLAIAVPLVETANRAVGQDNPAVRGACLHGDLA